MQFQVTVNGEPVGFIEAESEEAARADLAHERVFAASPVELTEVTE